MVFLWFSYGLGYPLKMFQGLVDLPEPQDFLLQFISAPDNTSNSVDLKPLGVRKKWCFNHGLTTETWW